MTKDSSDDHHHDGDNAAAKQQAGMTSSSSSSSSSSTLLLSEEEMQPRPQQQQQQAQPPSLQRRLTVVLQSEEEAAKLQRQVTNSSAGMAVAGEHVMELEFEEWDGSTPFYQHCLAGSIAGVAEHLLMYPFDTLKTQIQSYCADCPHAAKAAAASAAETTSPKQLLAGAAAAESTVAETAGAGGTTTMLGALRQNIHTAGSHTAAFSRLWRGAQAMAVGCIPAHAMYFSSYEIVKSFFLLQAQQQQAGADLDGTVTGNLGALGSTVAGSTAALCHDAIMVPADTIKQRLQLGYYAGMTDAFRTMVREEGAAGLYRALPVTLCTNLPYGAVMVATNEYLRECLMRQQQTTALTVQTTLLAGCGAGAVAAAVTTPLDRLKTRLQTQGLSMVLLQCDAAAIENDQCPKLDAMNPKYSGLKDAYRTIVREEGYAGLFRGLVPRLLTHTPSVAISWTVYEAMKLWLMPSSSSE